MALLATYQSLLALSQQMAEMANAEDWNALVDMEAKRSALWASLPRQLPPMPPAEAQSVAQAIQGILDCNRSIEDCVKPRMAQLGTLLAAFDGGKPS
jgi:hypothetical protein